MGSRLFRLNHNKFVFHVISISLAAAVVLVFLGPVVDHHFVERQHNHSHIYLNGSVGEHWHPESHPFEKPHSHSNLIADGSGRYGIIYQTSNDCIGDSSTSPAVAFMGDAYPQVLGIGSSTSTNTVGEINLVGNIVSPPKKPPIT